MLVRTLLSLSMPHDGQWWVGLFLGWRASCARGWGIRDDDSAQWLCESSSRCAQGWVDENDEPHSGCCETVGYRTLVASLDSILQISIQFHLFTKSSMTTYESVHDNIGR